MRSLSGQRAAAQGGSSPTAAEPNTSRVADPPRDVSYYVEARQTLVRGFFVAGRYGAISFVSSRGRRAALNGSSDVRGEYMINRTLVTTDPDVNLLALRWPFAF